MQYPPKALAILTLAGVVASPAGSAIGWQNAAPLRQTVMARQAAPPAVPAKPAPVAKQAPKVVVPPPADGDFPRSYTTASGAKLVLYQPQVESWPNQKWWRAAFWRGSTRSFIDHIRRTPSNGSD